MANFVDSSHFEYTTKLTPGWFTKAIQDAVMLSNGYLTVIPDVTKDLLFKKMSGPQSVSQVDNRDCEWTPGEGVTLDSKLVTLNNFKINEQQCLDALDNIYSQNVFSGQGGTAGAFKTDWPNYDGFGDKVMHFIYGGLKADIDKIIIGGEGNEVSGVQEGLVDLLLADSESIKVSGTEITADNVLDEVDKVINAIPDGVVNGYAYDQNFGQLTVFMPYKVYMLLMKQMAQIMNSNVMIAQLWNYTAPVLPNSQGRLSYLNINMAPVPCMPANTMIAAAKGNLVFATDLLSDTSKIVVDNGAVPYENVKFIKGQYRAKADYVSGDECVIYSA